MAKQPKETNMSKKSNTAKVNKVDQVEQNETITEVTQSTVERVRPQTDDKGRYKTVDMSMEEIEKLGFKTKSATIRYLASQNFSPTAISKFLGIIYQHVRNELNRELKRPQAAPVQPSAPAEEKTEG